MSLIPPIAMDRIPERAVPLFEHFEKVMGFVPSSMQVMAHKPQILEATAKLAAVIFGPPGSELEEIKFLAAYVSSRSAGCRYCQAHTAATGINRGIDEARISAAFEFETSDLFSEAEKAVLTVAAKAGMVPNSVERDDVEAMRRHYGDEKSVELMAMIALYGFLNRWNDTLATHLETEPAEKAGMLLRKAEWEAGKHGKDRS